MKPECKKYAYTLSEIMTVMLVLTTIFAACAPFITKRKVSAKNANAVWQIANSNTFDAQTDSENGTVSNQLFFGLTPESGDDVNSKYAPKSKLVIRSGEVSGGNVQRQLQFRYGKANSASPARTDKGIFAGTWFMDGRNVLMGGGYNGIKTGSDGARQNVAIGYEALTNLTDSSNNTAVGYRALAMVTKKPQTSGSSPTHGSAYNTAVGYNAGSSMTESHQNTYVGAGAGADNKGERNTAIGYNAGKSGTGSDNLFIGYNSGRALITGTGNVAVGSNALENVTSGNYNTALGYNALNSLTSGSHNVAIGAYACDQVTSGSYKTCIGYNSGPKAGTKGVGNFINGREDNIQRTYIGSKPHNFGGDAVLELHNTNTGGTASGMSRVFGAPASNATTVVNGNLIVRGRVFLTSGTGLYHMHDFQYPAYREDGTRAIVTYWGKTGNNDTLATDVTTYNFSLSSFNQKIWGVSDRRLKNIGLQNNDGLDKLTQLKIYNYTFKNDEKKLPHVGVMAQDLQKVFPNSVFKGEDGYLRIRWDEMFFASINAVKELDRKITNLVTQTFKVESKIAKLEKENTLLKVQVDTLSQRVNKLKAQ